MRKLYGLILLLFLVAACSGTHVPPQPPPPPVVCGDHVCSAGEICPADCDSTGPRCGDGDCNGSETRENCPADCPQITLCGNGTCDPGEQSTCPDDCPVVDLCAGGKLAFPDCPPPAVPPSARIRTIGVYVAIAVDPKVDFDVVGKDAYLAGYNSLSAFGTTAFGNQGLWPWPLKGGKFDYSQINPAWRAHTARMFEHLAFWRIDVHYDFVDQFHSAGDNPGPDPFRQGLGQGSDWNEEPLYSSWDGTNYQWVKWDEPKPRVYTNFTPIGDFGKGMQLYIQAVIQEAARVRDLTDAKGNLKYPYFRLSWKWGNETLTQYEPATGKITPKRGDRDEIYNWIRQQWKDAGFKEGKNVQGYFDYFSSTAGKTKKDPDYVAYSVMRTALTAIKQHGAKLEVHGILKVSDTARFGFSPVDQQFVKWSTDGDLGMNGDYKDLGHSSLPDVDLKFDIRKGEKWDTTDFMKNWVLYFGPRYSKYIQ